MKFLMEIVARFFSKTPKFFKILRWLGIAVAIITGLPEFLIAQGVDLPAPLDAVANQVVAIAAVVGSLIAQLTATIEEKQTKNLSDA